MSGDLESGFKALGKNSNVENHRFVLTNISITTHITYVHLPSYFS